ncbi:MAG: PKD-like domain-containing protein [Spirosomataceae bacterium]
MLKKLRFLSCVMFVMGGVIFEGAAQTISTVLVTTTSNTIPSGGYCTAQQIRVAFTAAGFPANTTFSVQLSDASGAFPGTALGSGTASPITVSLPGGTIASSNYRVRVTSGAASANSAQFQINPIATVNPVASQTPCNGASVGPIVFSSSSAGATFSWTSSANVGFGTSGAGNIPTFTAINPGTTATVTVTPSVNGCSGTPTAFTVAVQAGASVNSIANANLCNGAGSAGFSFSSPTPGATFAWTSSVNVGFGTSGTGNIPGFTAANASSSAVTATVTVTPTANGCTGTPRTFSVTVFPTNITVNQVANIAYCDNASVGTINFTSPTAGVTFDWTSSMNVGFGTSGSGNINSFTANNNGTTDAVATVTVTPKAGGCPGTPMTFTVTVRPQATVSGLANVSYCNGASGAAINFSGPTAGATYSWSSSASVGFGTSGTGSIPAFTAANGGTSVITANVTVTPSYGGCTGASSSFAVTVNPTATVNSIANLTYCGGTPVSGISFTSPSAGTSFSWSSNANAGFGTSGTGNIPGYTTTNSSNTQVVATVNVTPSVGGCQGTSRSFTVTVNPTPTVSALSNAVYCNNTSGAAVAFSGPVAGTAFGWVSSLNVGFGLSGNGNIAAFAAANLGVGPVVSTISVTPTTGTCTGPVSTFTITVNPTPSVGTIADASFCGNFNAPGIAFSSATPNTSFAWSSSANVGFGTSGTGNIGGYTTVDNDAATVATITVTPTANTCVGTARNFTVTVNPSPKVNTVTSAVYCNAASAAAIGFSSPTTGTTFAWTASANVGFGASGTGNIAAYTATNGGPGIVISTVNVTAKTATCTGPVKSFTVTVNPTPVVNTIGNMTYCGSATGTAINFSSPTSGTAYAWSSSGNVGFGTSGSGNIAGYTVTNPITTTSTATVTVTPTANSCVGPASNFTITVNPTPAVNSLPNLTFCAGATGSPITFSSDTPNTNFNWSSPTNVGFGVVGSGNIGGGFSALNNSQNVVVSTVSVIPATSTCTGAARTFTFTVNPTPGNPGATTPIVYCATAIPEALVATGSNLKWYTEASGGTGSGVAPTPSTNNATDNSITTNYYVSQTNQYSCESQRSQVQVTVKPLPPVAQVSKQEYLLCQFDPSFQLDAKLQGTGQSLLWFLPNSAETTETPTITTAVGFEGTFAVLQIRDGCRGPRTEIKVNVRTTPAPAVSAFPVTNCQNATPQPLSATGTNLKWYNTNKTGGNPQSTPNIPPTQTPGTYQFYVTQTGANGCESPRAEITVIIQPLPSATVTGGSTITQGQSAPLSLDFTGQGPWTYTLSNGLTLTTNQNPTTVTVSPLETTVFTITKITNACGEGSPAGSATINVRVATIDVGNPSVTTVCAGSTFAVPYFSSDFFPSNTQFRVQMAKTNDDASFQTVVTEGNSSPLTATVPAGASGGSYFVRVVGVASNFTVKGKVSPVQITVRELPTATLSGPTSIYENESAKLSIAFTGENPWRVAYRDSLAQKDTTFTTSATPFEFTVKPAKTNTYRILSISNGCGNGPATSRLVLTVNPLLSVVPTQNSEWIKVYPVPVQARCTIEIEGGVNKPVSLTISDGFGRIMLKQQTSAAKDEMDFSTLAPGVYYLNAEQDGRVARRKILKIQ